MRFVGLEKAYLRMMYCDLLVGQNKSYYEHSLRKTAQRIEQVTVASTGIFIWRIYGLRPTIRYLVGLILALMAQRLFLFAVGRKTGTKQASLADVLTLCRVSAGSVLAGLV